MGAAAVALLGLDWGSTHLRASLLDEAGHTVALRASAAGVMAVPAGGFEPALRALCGDWLADHPGLPVLASGMVGSRQGWVEAPYLGLPAGPEQAAAALTVVPLRGHQVHIVPGLSHQPRPGRFDVMRGEETQVWGASAGPGTHWCVLPGTHSKWVQVDGQGRLLQFHTHMTGELYALLSQHGTPGRLMVQGHSHPQAFEAGVALGAAEHAQAMQAMFAVRTAGLLGGVPGEALPDYLSGVLIGMELASARHSLAAELGSAPLRLIGEAALCGRYQAALQLLGCASVLAAAGATERGLWRVAQSAGLVRQAA